MSAGSGPSGLKFQRALAHHGAGRVREAEALLLEMVAENPRDANALRALGLLAAEGGRNDIAAGFLQQVVALVPGNGGLHGELGEMLRRSGRLVDAARECRRAVELAPGGFGGHYNLGVVLQAQEQFAAAAESYRRALGLDKKHAGAHYNLGNALRELGAMDEAIASYERALALRPEYVEARGNLGLALQAKGELVGAAACFARVIAERPGDAVAHNSLGNILRERGELQEALAHYRTAVELAPGDGAAQNNLGKLLHDMGEVAEAMGHYELAIAASPERGEAYQNLGMALEKLGRREEAKARYRQALERGVGAAEARYHMAAATGLDVPVSAPAEHVTKVFDELAESFDVHLVKKLKYRGPELLLAAVRGAGGEAGAAGSFKAGADLGCGTGLCGVVFKPLCARLVGVDLSAAMIEKSRQRNVYDALFVGDVERFLVGRPGAFDLLLAGDVLVYVGDLGPIFAAASGALVPGGLFAFSVESGEEKDYALLPTRRYAHAPAYVDRLAAAHQFALVQSSWETLRMEAGRGIMALIAVLRREG